MKRIVGVFVAIALVCVMASGCSSQVSENKPISQIINEAQTMSVEQLQATIAKYQKAIESKQAEIDAIRKQLQKIPLAQMMEKRPKSLKPRSKT